MEEYKLDGHVHGPINTTFIALIPKRDHPKKFDDFLCISLCNCLYKIMAKVISRRLKVILSRRISNEQFGFLEGRQIHEAIGVDQEGLHSVKTHRLKGAVVKIDLSKVLIRLASFIFGCYLHIWVYVILL